MEAVLETEVRLERLQVRWLDEVVLKNLFLEDLYGDTLLISGNISADFNLNPITLIQRGLEIEALHVSGAQFNIQRQLGDTTTNLQYALARLFPPKEQQSSNPLSLNLREVQFDSISFTQNDSIRGSYLAVQLDAAQAWLENLDFASRQIDINTINVVRPTVVIRNWEADGYTQPLEALDSLALAADTNSLQLTVGEFRLSGARFALDNLRKSPVKTTPADQLDLKHLNLYDIQMEIDSFRYHRDTFQAQVNWIAAKDRSGFELKRLSAREAFVSPTRTTLNNLHIITPTSHLGDELEFRYRSYEDWKYFDDRVRLEVGFRDADVTLKDIIAFVPKLRYNRFFWNNRNTNLQLDGQVRGHINRSFRSDDIRLALADGSRLNGKFSTQKLATPGEEFLILELPQLSTRMRTLRDLIPNFNLPPNYDKLGRLNFNGTFVGFLADFVANGELRTDLGQAAMDMQMVLKDGPEQATYQGRLALSEFDLGRWSGNADLGLINFSSEVSNGQGLTTEVVSADLTAAVESLSFKGYTYENANLTGQLNKNFFNGELTLKDDNIDFTFLGELDFRDSIPVFDFAAQVRRLALYPLNLAQENIVLSGKIDLNIRDTQFSSFQGEARMEDILLTRYNIEEYAIDHIYATSFFDASGEKVFRMDSDVAKGEIRGAFEINEVPATLQLFLLRNYPGFSDRLKLKPPRRTPEINSFSYDFHIADSKGLHLLVDPRLGSLEDIDFSGRYSGAADSLQFRLEMPSFSFGKLTLNDVFIDLDALQNAGDLDIFIQSTYLNEKKRLNEFSLISILQSDTIDFALNVGTDTPNLFDNLNMNGLFLLPDSLSYALQFKQSNLSLLQTPWTIDADNRIRVTKDAVQAENFVLYNKDRRIRLRNHLDKGLTFDLDNFDFSFIDQLWDYDPLNFSGRFDMDISIDNLFELSGLNAQAQADSFFINDDSFGTFRLAANLADLKNQLTATVKLARDTTKMDIVATYNLADIGTKLTTSKDFPLAQQRDYLDIDLKAEGFPLNIAEYWLRNGLKGTHGSFSADLRLAGPSQRLNASGYIDARQGGFTIIPLQTAYTFKKGLINASNFLFDASGTQIFDKYGNMAYINGGISHNHLRQMGLRASMETRRFLGLDLKPGDNDVFYGQALGSGEVVFSGDFQQPNIYINATVADSTSISIPITDQVEKQQLDFVTFVNKHLGSQQTTNNGVEKPKGLNLEMDLRITEVADLELIFDETAGDVLKGKGRGDLRILLPRAGDFEMYGDITVTDGNYLFTLYDVINKDFKIKPGGRLLWSGDPYNARINIQATYKDLKTSLSGFIQEYLVEASSDLKTQASQATSVDLTLILQGELFSPDISFDIAFPDLQGQLRNLADNKLSVLERDPDETNKQVFGLIVVGQFLPSDLSFQSDQVIFNTVSEMVSNQLSLFLTKVFSDILGEDRLAFDIAYNRYDAADLGEGQTIGTGEAVEFSFRTDFFDDRLSVQLGGNVEFGEDVVLAYNGAFFGTDLAFEYAINPSRDLKVRLYQRREPDLGVGQRWEIGTGLTWRKEFNTFEEFWRAIRGK
jgi:hypothetical protein